MGDSELKNLVSSLKGDSDAMHLDLDITMGLQQFLLEKNQLLIGVLAKVMMIPFIEDYTNSNIMGALGLTNSQASSIQEVNVDLLNIHKMTQSYIIQTYTIFSMLKEDMDKLVLENVPEFQDVQTMDDLFEYIANYNEVRKEQSGGVNFRMLLLTILAKLIIFSIVAGNTDVNRQNIVPATTPVSELSLTKFNLPGIESQFSDAIAKIENSEYKMSRSANVSTLLSEYDSVMSTFYSFFDNRENGRTYFERIVDEFNEKASGFTQECTLKCTKLVEDSAKLGVYSNYIGDIDSVSRTEDKLTKLDERVKKETQEMINAGVAGVGATIATAATGDLVTAATYAYTALTSFGKSGSSEELAKQRDVVLRQADQSKPPAPSEKIEREDALQQFSSLFCNYGFNLKLVVSGTSLSVYGDKVEYNSLLGLIIMLERNIDFKTTTTNVSENDRQALDSLKQHLQVLKTIVEKLRQFVNFAFYARVSTLKTAPTPTSLNQLHEYLNTQLKYLVELSEKLKETFPMTTEYIRQQGEIQQAQGAIQKMEAEVERLKAKDVREIQQITSDADRIIASTIAETIDSNTNDSALVTKAYWGSILTPVFVHGSGIGDLSKLLGAAVAKVPLGAVEGVAGETTNSFSRILYSLFSSPGGLAIVMGSLFMLAISLGITVSSVYLFKDGVNMFLCIVKAPFVIVYRITNTSAGLAYRLYDFIVLSRRGRAITNGETVGTMPVARPSRFSDAPSRRKPSQFDVNLPEYLSNVKKTIESRIGTGMGGKRRKTRRTLGRKRRVVKTLHKKANRKTMKTKKRPLRRKHNTRRKNM